MKAAVEQFPRENNLDLLRLFAAFQVVFIHSFANIFGSGSSSNSFLQFLEFLPSVPLFFFLSGFLITQSYERSTSLTSFAKNRVLRLYPALWLCIILSVLMLLLTGYIPFDDIWESQFLLWLFTQGSFLQFYNPAIFYDFGTGVINTSLWTISIELQFYILTPLLTILVRYKKLYILLFIISILLNIALNQLNLRELMAGKLVRASFLLWIYMFMAGQLAHLNWKHIQRFVSGRTLLLFAIFLSITMPLMFVENLYGIRISGNAILFPSFLILALLALSLAIYRPWVSKKLLKGNDISYGIYIYHMPIINLFLFYTIGSSWFTFILLVALIIAVSFLSWTLVERPALRLKSYSIRPR